MTMNAAQRGFGNTRVSMVTNVSANLVNVALNYLLINGIWIFPRPVSYTHLDVYKRQVFAKDLALWIKGILSELDVNGQAIEYHGEGVSSLSLSLIHI